MANTRVTSLELTREFLRVLHSNLPVVRNMNKAYQSQFGSNQAGYDSQKIGPTLNIRKPSLGTTRTTWAMSQTDLTESYLALTVDQVVGVDLNFSDADLALSIDAFSERYIKPNAMLMASKIEQNVLEYIMQNTHNNTTQALGTAPSTNSTFLNAARYVKENLAPMDGQLLSIISPATEASMVGGLAGQYNPQPAIATQWQEGQMANALGMKWFMSQVLPSLSSGTRTNTDPLCATYTEGASSMVISGGTTSGTIVAGDTFVLSSAAHSISANTGCMALNPETKQSYNRYQQFVVTESVTLSGGGGTVTFSPAIYWSTGPNKNVSLTPVNKYLYFFNNAASGIYQQDLVMHKDAFTFAAVPLIKPNGMDMSEVVSSDGISIRFLRGYDIVNARMLSRMDCFFGRTKTRPEWACKIYT